MKHRAPSPVVVAAGAALATAALATCLIRSVPWMATASERVAARILDGMFGTAQAAQIAPGSCPVAEHGPEGMRLVKAVSAEDPDLAVTTAMVDENGASASMRAGGCSAAVAAPGTTLAAGASADAPVDGAALGNGVVTGAVRGLDGLVEQAPPASIRETGPDPVEVATAEGDAAPQPAIASAQRRHARPVVVPDEAKKAWWRVAESGKLNLGYAGQASFGAAIALLFDGTFETPESANQNIQVKSSNGEAVRGQWVVAANRQMLLFSVGPGVYSVDVGPGLRDQGGRGISAPSKGLVAVH